MRLGSASSLVGMARTLRRRPPPSSSVWLSWMRPWGMLRWRVCHPDQPMSSNGKSCFLGSFYRGEVERARAKIYEPSLNSKVQNPCWMGNTSSRCRCWRRKHSCNSMVASRPKSKTIYLYRGKTSSMSHHVRSSLIHAIIYLPGMISTGFPSISCLDGGWYDELCPWYAVGHLGCFKGLDTGLSAFLVRGRRPVVGLLGLGLSTWLVLGAICISFWLSYIVVCGVCILVLKFD